MTHTPPDNWSLSDDAADRLEYTNDRKTKKVVAEQVSVDGQTLWNVQLFEADHAYAPCNNLTDSTISKSKSGVEAAIVELGGSDE